MIKGDTIINGNKRGGPQSNKARINDQIRVTSVRLIDAEGNQVGVVSIREARQAATDAGLDLVEISPNAEPPVCRIMDHGKFIYEQSKKSREAKKKQVIVQIKEIKFRPNTDEGDYQVKLRNLIRFLEKGDKTKVTVRFRGREMAHKDIGVDVLNRLKVDLEPFAVVEQETRSEGRQITMILSPKKR